MTEKRILIVDDDDAIRMLLFTILRRRGFKVDTASNGVEALERSADCRYSIVLLDLMMPRKSGWEVLKELERVPASERPLVIVLTAGSEPRNLDPQIVAGTIHKPFNIELVIETVSGCLKNLPPHDQREKCPESETDRLAN